MTEFNSEAKKNEVAGVYVDVLEDGTEVVVTRYGTAGKSSKNSVHCKNKHRPEVRTFPKNFKVK
jgi:hypothetical protein